MSLRFMRTTLSGVCAAVALTLSMPGSAHAGSGDDANLHSMEACQEWPSSSAFKFHIYYNSGMNGSWRNIGYSVWDFNAVRPGGSDPGAYPLKFCQIGASSPWPGSGQRIKNNAASAENDHYKYMANVHYNSGYKGPADIMGPGQSIARFRNVYNENASFEWTSS